MTDSTPHTMAGTTALRYASDSDPGIRRRGKRRFSYIDETTNRPPPEATLERIHALAVPPAWTDVWIARDPDSHLQATGRDARGRKQYRYHPEFTDNRANDKFSELSGFATTLGALRRRVDRDLRRDDLSHDRVVATVVRLLDVTSLRIGNPEYARTNESFGLTTLRAKHVAVRGSSLRLTFTGKSAHDFDVTVDNKRLAKIVRSCQHLPGQQLFQYRTVDGVIRSIASGDVNEYLGLHGRPGSTAKTFRTWNATVLAAEGLAKVAVEQPAPTKRLLNAVVDQVAGHLGNTRAVCRASYIHPRVIDAYLDETIARRWQRSVSERPKGLTVAERKTLRLLR